MHVLRYSPRIGAAMTSDRFRGLVAPPHSAEELAERAEKIVASLGDLPVSERGLVLRVALELATRDSTPPPSS